MNIAFIHNMEIELDSRTQKEINSLLKNGHQVFFCGWNKDKTGSIEEQEIVLRGHIFKFNNICIKVKKRAGLKENIYPLLIYYKNLFQWLGMHKSEIDAIHACNMDTAIAGMIYAKIHKKKFIYDIYDDYADSHVVGNLLHRVIKRIDAFVIRHADVVIICSEKREEQLATTRAKKIVIIHNTPDIKSVDSELMKLDKTDKLRLAYVGNLDDTRYIIELTSIIRKHPMWELHIGGGGKIEKEIKTLADAENNIFYYGRLDYEQTLSLEQNCDVLPALYVPTVKNHKYAAPNKFYEALYLGKPVIMFKETGCDNLVAQYRTGVVVPFDVKELENAISKIEDDIEFWKMQKDRIKSIYYDNFSWDIMEKRLLSIYIKETENE